MSERRSLDEYFLRIALEVATRATCNRKLVGTVLVRDGHQLATGYNGSIAGLAHCDDVGHMMEDGHCVRTIHSEMNAIIQAARHGVSIEGSTAYVTWRPCWSCFKSLANAGVKRIVYISSNRDDSRILDALEHLDIEWVQMDPHKPKPCYRIISRNPKNGPLSWYVVSKSVEKNLILDALSTIEYRNLQDVLSHPDLQILAANDDGAVSEVSLGYYVDIPVILEELSEMGMLHKI
jgi:dCMP deaminase